VAKKLSTKTAKVDPGYITTKKEGLANLEVGSAKYNMPFTGIHNLAEFCRTVMINYTLVSRTIRDSRVDGQSTCEIGDWVFTWMTLDSFRNYLEGMQVPISSRMVWIHGYIPREINDFPTVNREFAKLLKEFMS
jgi:hypothetical protein